MIDLGKFTEREVQQVTDWTMLTQAMLGMAVERNRDPMKEAVDDIAVICNKRWPLREGDEVAIGVGDLTADLSGFTEDVAVEFIARTAVCVFAGNDGPFPTAAVLKDGINTLADEIERRERA